MLQNCLPEEVVATLVTFVNGSQQKHHVLEQLVFAGPLADIVDSLDYDVVDDLAGVPVDQNNPLVYHESFILELDLDCLQHLHAPHNVV